MGFLAISQPDDCGFLLVRSMKYSININQIVLAKTKLDIKDAAILDYLKSFCMSDDKKVKQLTITEKGIDYRYTWINFNHLIGEMPLLRIKNKASISQRIKKIEEEGFIKIFRAPDRNLYVRLMPKIKELEFSEGVSKNKQGVSLNKQGVFVKTNSTNNISFKHNYNNSNNNMQSKALQVSGDEINNLIALFKEVNPTYERLFGNKTQRAAMERLVKKFGKEKVERMIKGLKSIFGKPYAPTITTPYLLEKKLADYISYLKKRSEEKINLIDVSKL